VARDAVAATPAGLSAAVRRLAIDRVAARLGVAPARLAIGKRDRIPELRLDGAPCDADLSLSHHGGVVAFACRLHAGHLPAARHPVPHLPTAHARRRLAS